MRPIAFCAILFLVAGILSSCWVFKKTDDPVPSGLPAATQEGKNTFGCYVNGELMVAVDLCRKTFCRTNPRYDPSSGLNVGGWMDTEDEDSPRFSVIIALKDANIEGRYSLDSIARYYPGLVTNSVMVNKVGSDGNYLYFVRSHDSTAYCKGEFVITKWVKGRDGFIAGTFWFDLYNPSQYADTIRVRDGRFDIAAP